MILSLVFLHFRSNYTLTTLQKRGWEPDAVLNWLLLCGYGVRHETTVDAGAKPSTNKQLDREKIMDLKEMIDMVLFLCVLSLQPIQYFLLVRHSGNHSTEYDS